MPTPRRRKPASPIARRFYSRDLFATDVGRATVVTVYLFPGVMARVGDKLRSELAPGTRVVSHDFPFPDWAPDRVSTVPSPEKWDYTGRADAVLLLHTVLERRECAPNQGRLGIAALAS